MKNAVPTQRILIVDDEAPVRALLHEILSARYAVDTAQSAEVALQLTSSREYSVMICDIDMPGMSGIELVAQIHDTAPNVVVLMISGNLSIDYALQALRLGAHDYLTKPFDIGFVERAVEKAVDHHSRLKEKERLEVELQELVRQRTEELNFLIYSDSLTKLPNRVRYEELLTQAILEAPRGVKIGSLLLSLDGFEKIRDHFGRSEADDILKEMAVRLRSVVGEEGCLARMQSDDFAIVISDTGASAQLDCLIEQIRAEVGRSIRCQGTEVFFSPSMGISFFPEDGISTQDLLKKAGNALGRARETGGDKLVYYSEAINQDSDRRINMEAELRRALHNSEFELHYQPKVSVWSGQIEGVEALVRWQHPEKGMIPPSEFIPLAEATGLIVPLGEFVLRSACTDGAMWHQAGFDLNIAVNVSARQLKQSDLADRFESIIFESGIDPRRLDLEVTESSIMENAKASIGILERLKSIGVCVSLDDFGTGYSSLAHLKKLPIDQLKIDREFIRDVQNDEDDTVLTMIIVNLAHSLRLSVVAEGVENEEQLNFLRSIGCDQYQGFFFSRPVPFADLTALLRDEKIAHSFPPVNDQVGHFAPAVTA
jgi:diguanylate cyclase (GGDEF)-like protein